MFFFVITRTAIYFNVGSATSEMKTNALLELVNNAYTLVILHNGTRVVLKINLTFSDTDPFQTKNLLATYQVCDFGVLINNCDKCHQRHDCTFGTQSICTPKGILEFNFMVENAFSKYINPHQRA